ncbi:MAG: HAD family phosphatase [Rhodobacteraceae bacterium]|nr:HAD family phosphatase [Paracoccaceae bacterium]
MPQRPEAVIFDIGNVLIEWHPERYFDTVMPPADRARMFASVDLHAMNDRIDRGGDFRAIIAETARANPAFADKIMHWHDHWLDLASPAIPRSVALSRALRREGITTCILSNIGRDTYDLAATRYPFLAEFDRHYLSGHMGVIKPEAEIYEMVEADCGLPPDRLLFTDDRADNIAAAAARGWQTHLFQSSEGWADALVRHGLLSFETASEEP